MMTSENTMHHSASESSFALVHQIFVLDAYLREPLDCSRQIPLSRSFINDTMNVLGLEPLGPLDVYPAVDDRAPGWSFIQAITTSHISAHYFEKPGKGPHIRIDAYSCDQINWRKLVNVCSRHFNLADWRGTFIDREIDRDLPRPVMTMAGHADQVLQTALLESPSLPSPLPNAQQQLSVAPLTAI